MKLTCWIGARLAGLLSIGQLIHALALFVGLAFLAAEPASAAWSQDQKVASESAAVVEQLASENLPLSAERTGEKSLLRYDPASDFPVAARGTAKVGELIATHGRTMSNKQLDKLVKSIRSEGIKEPLTVTEHQGKLYILDGHHRALAAPRAGIAEVPINRVELPFGAYKTVDDLIFTP